MAVHARSLLDKSRRELNSAMDGLDEEGFRRRPERGEWTAAEVLAHLVDYEAFLTSQIEIASASHDVAGSRQTNEERTAGARQAQRMPVPQLVHALLGQRRTTNLLLERDASAADAPQVNQYVAGMIEEIALHESLHAKQIVALRERITARVQL
jgi:hypothetical protein